MRSYKSSIQRKMLFTGLSIILGLGAFLFITVIYFYELNQQDVRAQIAAGEIMEHSLKMRKAEKDFQLRDLTDPQFFDSGTSGNLASHTEAYKEMEKNIEFFRKMNKQTFNENIGNLIQYTGDYKAAFLEFVNAYREKGFLEYGISGRFRDAAHVLEAEFNKLEQDKLLLKVLQLRRDEKDYMLRREEKYVNAVKEDIVQLKRNLLNIPGRDQSRAATALADYESAFEKYLTIEKKIGLTEELGLQARMRSAVHEIEPLLDKIVVDAMKASQQSYANMLIALVILIVTGVSIGGFVFYTFARSISRPVKGIARITNNMAEGKLTDSIDDALKRRNDELGMMAESFEKMLDSLKVKAVTLDAVAKGDLSQEVILASDQDQVGNALQQMKEALSGIIIELRNASNNVSSGSGQIASSSQQLAQGANEQASSVEEISSSVEEAAASIRQNTDNSSATEKIALRAASDARDGGEAVIKTVEAMKHIAEKISIIEEIARQTNLLALNAAIEAARAGEHGRGFAVVASEVRKLAERSQVAAAEISNLSRSSVEIAEQAGTMLQKMVPDIQKTADLVREINSASVEQNSGIQQINNAIQQLNSVVQQNAAAAEEMSSMAEELANQALQVKQNIGFFKIGSDDQSEVISLKKQHTLPERRQAHHGVQVKHLPQRTEITPFSQTHGPEKQQTPNIDESKNQGFNLDMSGSHDADDDEFKKY